MPSLLLGERDEPDATPAESVELAVCSRRRPHRARRWALRSVVGLGAFLALANLLPLAFGLTRYTVTDDAMSGTIDRGSLVFAKSLPVVDLEVGDVITYAHPATSGELVTRRIADIDGGVIWTRSDRTGAIDPWTLSIDRATQQRAVADIPYAGYVYDAVANGARELWARLPELP
jgi:signal peptidase I